MYEKKNDLHNRTNIYITGLIWWQFRKNKVKRRLFERIKTSNPSKYQSRIFKPNLR